MGVRGLTTYVDTHPELLTDFHLHDTRLIVDGNNLYHFLYYYYHVPCEYSGDYDHFARSCEAFFVALHSCSVVPYVVFDGSHAVDGSKFQTSLERAQQRVHLSNIAAWGRHVKLLPVLGQSCFIHVLDRLRIEHVTCDFEADCEIAALAQQWNCPVLTNDSDFFVYNIPAGVVLLDYINIRSKTNHGHSPQNSSVVQYRYINCQIFYSQKFVKFLRVNNHSCVVLLATLLGNDIIDGRSFENFYSSIRLPKAREQRPTNHKQCLIAGIIAWLQTVHSANEAVAFILSKIPEKHRKNVSSLMEASRKYYSEPKTELDKYFGAERDQKDYTVRMFGDCMLPDWFAASVRHGAIPSAMLNVLASQRLLLLSQIELASELSSHKCSQKLRQLAQGIALSVCYVGRNAGHRSSSVSEYNRDCRKMRMSSVESVLHVKSKPLPVLSKVDAIDIRERFRFLLDALDTSLDDVFGLLLPDVQFLVATVQYWLCNANGKVSKLHIHALLLCCLKLGSLDSYLLISPQSRTIHSAIEHTSWLRRTQKLRSCPISDLTAENGQDLFLTFIHSLSAGLDCEDGSGVNESAIAQEYHQCHLQIRAVREKKLIQFDFAPRHNHAMTYSAAVVYAFSELQSCFMAAACVASMLGLSVHDPACIFNGTVLYNLMRDLQSRSDPDKYVSELLGGPSSQLTTSYFHLVNAVLAGVPEGRLEEVDLHSKRKKRKNKKNTGKAFVVDSVDSDSGLQDILSGDADAEGYVVNCDLDNRFSNLSLSEE